MATVSVRNQVLDKLLSGTAITAGQVTHMSLHTADPGETGTSEISGGSYARQAITFDAAATGTTDNSATITFDGPASDQTITYVGLWTAVSGGTFIWAGAMTTSKTFGSGDQLQFSAGSVTASTTAS